MIRGAFGKLFFAAFIFFCAMSLHAKEAPNVILIMSDDQGYGDIKVHGHPFIRTPHMDKLHGESVRFTDFHVAPMCTPTRSQLMTGVDAMKNGATAVCEGRSMIRREIPTLANYFADAGYKTILSGKWHLGDSYPHRPQDRGFQEVLSFRAWGLPALASHWSNSFVNPEEPTDSYTEPVLAHNGKDKRYKGYVTDILFDHAMEQISRCKADKKPFFLYLPTPTPHTPNIAPPHAERDAYYQQVFKERKSVFKKSNNTIYYKMIENIDDNLGRLEKFLSSEGLKDNTILVYLSDNGTQSRVAPHIYNAGMKGRKQSVYEGGHRVPLFVRWIKGGLQHTSDVDVLTQVQDICPTLLNLCNIYPKNLYPQNGHDLTPLLRGKRWNHDDRFLAIQYKSKCNPWSFAVALQGPWRLIKGALYNIKEDPGQKRDLSTQYPEKAKTMSAAYDQWHKEAFKEFKKVRYIDLGHPDAPQTILYASDWDGSYCDNPGGLVKSKGIGVWHVNIAQNGRYKVELSRWPFEAHKTMREHLDSNAKKPRGARPIAFAELKIYDETMEKPVEKGDKLVSFEMELKAGTTTLRTMLYDEKKKELCSANYVRVTTLP